MLWVGLTGGIASGKSTVAAILERLGVTVVTADRLAHDVIAPGTEGARRVRERFGDSVFSSDGSVDRAKLGTLVFGDPSGTNRIALEEITHPEVRKKSESERLRLESRGDAVGVYEIPLLFEKNLVDQFDLVVTVAVSPEIQVDRLMKRSGLSQEQAYLRINSQMPEAAKIIASDFVIWNDGDERELRKQTENIFNQIKKSSLG